MPAGDGGSPPVKALRAAPPAAARGRARSRWRAGQGQAYDDGTAGFLVRPAREGDLDVIAGFEIVDIARASFGGDEAIEDPALHRKRVAGALGKPGEVTLVAVAVTGEVKREKWKRGREAGATARRWAGPAPSGRTNSLTGARYGNFRSLATADIPGRGIVAELLMAAVVQAAAQAVTPISPATHARNLGMRALYRKFGFEADLDDGVAAGRRRGPGDGPVTTAAAPRLVKRAVWNIHNTLVDGVDPESGDISARREPGHGRGAGRPRLPGS